MKYFLSTANKGNEFLNYHFGLHVLPGLILFSWPATWLAYNVLQRHYRIVLSDGQTPFRSRLWYPGPCNKRVSVDSVVRIIAGFAVAVGEIFSCCLMEYKHGIEPEDQQHAVLYFGYFVAGFFEVLVSVTGSEKTAPASMLPAGVDRAASMLSAMVSVFVFSFHSHGEVALQTQLHGYYSWLAMALVLSHVAEVLGQRHVWLSLVRPYVLLLIGNWSCQIGFVLYFPTGWSRNWEDSSTDSKITVAFLMCCHLVMTFIYLVTVAVFVRCREIGRLPVDFLRGEPIVNLRKSNVQYRPLQNVV